jgi:lipopolysaccharide biosynthesis protein
MEFLEAKLVAAVARATALITYFQLMFDILWGSGRLASVKIPRLAAATQQITFVIHLHFEWYLKHLFRLAKIHSRSQILIATSNSEVARKVALFNMTFSGRPLEVVICPNRGRNFGGLWATIPSIDEYSKVVVHLHSKASQGYVSRHLWSMSSWYFTAFKKSNLDAVIAIMESDLEISTISVFSPLVFPWSFDWQKSDLSVAGTAIGDQALRIIEPFYYPIGGMFVIKPAILKDIERKLGPANFKEETEHQVSNLEYALERLVAVIPYLDNGKNLAFIPELSRFVDGQSLADTVHRHGLRRDRNIARCLKPFIVVKRLIGPKEKR